MILCDTNIIISSLNGRENTIKQLDLIGINNIVLSSITVMELYQGVWNKRELIQMRKNIEYFDTIQIDEKISIKAIELIEEYRLSHGLEIPDAIIGATAICHNIELYTYNLKDFSFLSNIKIYQEK